MIKLIFEFLIGYSFGKILWIIGLYFVCVYYDDDDFFGEFFPFIFMEWIAIYKILKKLMNKLSKRLKKVG